MFAEFGTTSNFSFLRGASHPKDLVLTSILRGHTGMGLADRNSVAGVVRAWSALKRLRKEGLSPPDVLRDGGGPGEVTYVDDPLSDPAMSEVVKARTTDLMQASMKLGEAMYAAQAADGEGGEPQPEGENAQKDDVIDADFQEVDDKDQKKRA